MDIEGKKALKDQVVVALRSRLRFLIKNKRTEIVVYKKRVISFGGNAG